MFAKIHSSITKKTTISVALALTFSLGLSLFILLYLTESAATENKKLELKEFSTIMAESITFAMSEGSTDVTPFIERASKIENIAELRIVPSDIISEGSEREMDKEESKVVKSGEPIYLTEDYNEIPVFRLVEPIKAEESCTSCHEGNEGDILATMSIRYSMADTYSNIFYSTIYGGHFDILKRCRSNIYNNVYH